MVVAIFLLVLYRFLGLVAVFGLAIYAALYYAAILLFNVTLTLPGFAGLILTIGVAADANVVVFERIKEEVRSGKSVRAAISAGYGKGFHTILDANVVTAITALVLFLIAVASVKGFALMLLIGTLISLLTAVAATRAMLGLLSGFRWFDNPRFMGAHGQQTAKWLQIDFMRRRYLWFALSGIDHRRRRGVARRPRPQPRHRLQGRHADHVQDARRADDPQDPQHRRRGRAAGRGRAGDAARRMHGGYSSWQVRTKSLKGAQLSTLDERLRAARSARTRPASKDVSSSFGHQIAIDAIWGILVSLALIIIYIALRFDIKFAVPVIIAMIHDILVTVGVYSLVFKEVTVDTVAAVLTVLGYSIYDTIIIFDRIRENVPLMRRQPFATIANISLWETIRRSLATTFITLLPIAALEILGGSTLKDFAFALLIGVTSGAYSSIFIAAPLLTMWKEREPEYARRKQLRRRRRAERCRRAAAPQGRRRDRHGGAARSRSRRSPPSRRRSSSTSSARRRRSRRRRRGARSGASAGGRGRTAVPGSSGSREALEELLAELPARVRGSRSAAVGEQAVSVPARPRRRAEPRYPRRPRRARASRRAARASSAIARRAARRAAGVGRRIHRTTVLEALGVVHDVRADGRERQLGEHGLEHRLRPSRRRRGR